MQEQVAQPSWETPTSSSPVAISPPTPTPVVPSWDPTATPSWEIKNAAPNLAPSDTHSIMDAANAATEGTGHVPLFNFTDKQIGDLETEAKNSTVGTLLRAEGADIVRPFSPQLANEWQPKGIDPNQGPALNQIMAKTAADTGDMLDSGIDAFVEHPIDTMSYILQGARKGIGGSAHDFLTSPGYTLASLGVGLAGNPQYAIGLGTEGIAAKAGAGMLRRAAEISVAKAASLSTTALIGASSSVLQQVGTKGSATTEQTAKDTIGLTSLVAALHISGLAFKGLGAIKQGTEQQLNVTPQPTPYNENQGGLIDVSSNAPFEAFNKYTPEQDKSLPSSRLQSGATTGMPLEKPHFTLTTTQGGKPYFKLTPPSSIQSHIEAVNDAVSTAPKDPNSLLGKNQEAEIVQGTTLSPSALQKPYYSNLIDYAKAKGFASWDHQAILDSINADGTDLHGVLREQLAARIATRVKLNAPTVGDNIIPENETPEELLARQKTPGADNPELTLDDVKEQAIHDSNIQFRRNLGLPDESIALPRQGGGANIDLKTATVLAGTIAGATYGFAQNGIQGLFTGASGAGLVTALGAYSLSIGKLFQTNFKGDSQLWSGKIQPFLEKWDGEHGELGLDVLRYQAAERANLTPEEALQIERHRQGDPTVPRQVLSNKQMAFVDRTQILYKRIGLALRSRGLIHEPLEDYWSRTFEPTDKTPTDLKNAFKTGDWSRVGTGSRHFISRSLANGWEGVKYAQDNLGLKLKDQDAVTNTGNYLGAAHNAIINFDMYKDLKTLKDINGKPLIMSSASNVPDTYRPVLTGLNKYLNKMQGQLPREAAGVGGAGFINRNLSWFAHPGISEPLKFLTESSHVGPKMAALDSIQFALKRSILFSGFHAKTLSQHQIVANYNLKDGISTFSDAAQVLAGTHPVFKQLLYGKSGDIVSQFVRNGGTIAPPEDVGSTSFYQGVDNFRKALDNHLGPIASPAIALTDFYKSMAKRFDYITWQRAMTGGKLITFTNWMDKETLRNQKNVNLNPQKFRQLSQDEIAKGLTLTVNDFFGGQNWLRTSMDSSTEWMRNIKSTLFKPNARKIVQRMTFAPDWFVSNFRAASRAAPYAWNTFKTSMGGEAPANAAIAKYHMYFAARAALTYVLVADTINKINSGHHIWQNKDVGTVELDPEGSRTMNLDKALTDDIELFVHPLQRSYNELGIFPKEAAEQAFNKQYIHFGSESPPISTWNPDRNMLSNLAMGIGNRAGHMFAKGLPIAARIAFEGPQGKSGISPESLENAASGFSGFPIYEHRTKQGFPNFLSPTREMNFPNEHPNQ